MPATNSIRKTERLGRSSRVARTGPKIKRKKRKLSCSSMEDMLRHSRCKRPKRNFNDYLCKSIYDSKDSKQNDRLVIEERLIWDRVRHITPRFRKRIEKENICKHSSETKQNFAESEREWHSPVKCWIDDLPQEILLKIFGYLPLGMLLNTVPQVCKKWEILALDWTLWKAVEDLTIKNMVISTAKLRTLLRTIPKLKKVEFILRNDTEELLHELFESHQNLEVLKLDRCYRSTLQMNILSQTVISILEFCPKLKTIMLTDTYFHSKNFYRFLAKKFRTIERINVTCTTRSEMDVFMENLKENVPEVEFQRVPMMGRAEGKQIYWGPILGLVVRPIPTSPFHQHYIGLNNNYPNYAF